jgi:hypothetical protein
MKQYTIQNRSQKNSHSCVPLKGSRPEQVGSVVFMQSKPVWVDELGTWIFLYIFGFGLMFSIFVFLAYEPSALTNCYHMNGALFQFFTA